MARLLVDIGPLRRFPQYRRLWIGYSISAIGSQLTTATVAYQVYLLTHSSLDVGLVSAIQIGPAFIAPIIGGAVADAFNRRYVLIVTSLSMAGCSTGLALNAQSLHPGLLPLLLLPSLLQAFAGISQPASVATQMTLVDKESFVAANVIRQTIQRMATVIGPTIAGVLIASGGLRITYWIDVASYFVAVYCGDDNGLLLRSIT